MTLYSKGQYQRIVIRFGLKVAPSIFQEVMIKIFEPILYSTLVYNDDILLYFKTREEHHVLLNQFLELVQSYGVILSEKKSTIRQSIIGFLGMKISNENYELGVHIAQELHKFSDEILPVKEIQQFLGFVIYIKDFILNCSSYTNKLFKLIRKNLDLTLAFVHLKASCNDPPFIQIPGKDKIILQTDARDDYWVAILLEDVAKKTYYCMQAINSKTLRVTIIQCTK